MEINTASAAIGFAKKLEEDSAKLYESLSQKYAQDGALFLSFVKENKKYVVQIERAYYGVITDALEGGYAFSIDPDEYIFEIPLDTDTDYSDALGKAIGMEEKITKFYFDAAEQSKSLMADVPRAFVMIAKKRGNRREVLKSLLGERT
ncbi:hypothetical protein ACFLV3_06795 [Chloroflexota bacterium]